MNEIKYYLKYTFNTFRRFFFILYTIFVTGTLLYLYLLMNQKNNWAVTIYANLYHEYYFELYAMIIVILFGIISFYIAIRDFLIEETKNEEVLKNE